MSSLKLMSIFLNLTSAGFTGGQHHIGLQLLLFLSVSFLSHAKDSFFSGNVNDRIKNNEANSYPFALSHVVDTV